MTENLGYALITGAFELLSQAVDIQPLTERQVQDIFLNKAFWAQALHQGGDRYNHEPIIQAAQLVQAEQTL